MQKVKLIRNYLLFLMPSFIITASIWSVFVDGKLYHCSDPLPWLDFFPPFVHGKQFGDYWNTKPELVYTLWIFLLVVMLSLPLILQTILKRKKIKV